MDVSGQQLFKASPYAVWQGICDPEALKACIPQCDSIVRLSDTKWHGTAKVKVGPFKILFSGDITLSEVNPPQSYVMTLVTHSKIGSAHGTAHVQIAPTAEGQTRLTYTATAHIGIKMLDKAMSLAAQLAQDLADTFFTRLAAYIESQAQQRGETTP